MSLLPHEGLTILLGFPNPQTQAIEEMFNQTLKQLLTQFTSREFNCDTHLALSEALFHLNLLTFDYQGVNPAYKLWVFLPTNTALPLA